MEEEKVLNEKEELQEKEEKEKENEIEKLKEELKRAEEERADLYDKLLRLSAEFDNFRKRTQKELERFKELANEAIIKELLLILDNFERALEAVEKGSDLETFVEGIKLIHRQFKETLKKFGVEEIEAEGVEFDPNFHEAVMQVEDEEKDNVIVQEVQKGYKLKGKLIRPSKVVVAKKKS